MAHGVPVEVEQSNAADVNELFFPPDAPRCDGPIPAVQVRMPPLFVLRGSVERWGLCETAPYLYGRRCPTSVGVARCGLVSLQGAFKVTVSYPRDDVHIMHITNLLMVTEGRVGLGSRRDDPVGRSNPRR